MRIVCAAPKSRWNLAPAAPAGPTAAWEWRAIAPILLLALAVRAAALVAVHEPLVSDAAAYMAMARSAILGPEMRDIYGNAALYSAGYPLLLAAVFRVFGISQEVARGLNLVLGLATVLLTWRVARAATGKPLVGLVAAFGAAVLIPVAAGTALLQRENLSTPLLLLFLLCVMALIGTRRPLLLTAAAGAVFGCGLLAGVSTLFTGAAFLAALALRRPGWRASGGLALVFAACVALVLAPWIAHVDRMVGRPVLSTNGGINLYDGNNPAATGRFVSIAETPIGKDWEAMRRRYGEAELSSVLQRMAIDHIVANPAATAALDLKKLVYFWLPDTPDPEDADHGLAITALRWAGAAQHMLILALAGLAVAGWRRWRAGLWMIAFAVLAFWAIHGIVYVIVRYRAPAMPLMLVLAAVPVAEALARVRLPRRGERATA